MSKYVSFSFELDKEHIHHLPHVSHYNHNYYELDLSCYGDYILSERCDVLYEECDDVSDSAYYSLGYFDSENKFVACFTWLEDHYKSFRTGAD